MKKNAAAALFGQRKIRISAVIVIIFILISLSIAAFFLYRFFADIFSEKRSVGDLYLLWSNGDYQRVHDISSQILDKSPFNNAARTMHGYASFYLAASETDPQQAQQCIDAAINSMRIALGGARKQVAPQLKYMLGKAYYFKNSFSAYTYYADLTVKYLLEAREQGYQADDIPEYLALSYVALGMSEESIAAFIAALQKRDSDVLNLALAEQYFRSGRLALAKNYLYRLNTESKNDMLLFKSHLLLGQIYLHEKDYEEALREYEIILEKDLNNADAYYGIGVIYEEQGDFIRARAEWRKALRVQVNHQGALQKLAGYGR
jgi:tetratricopeptide (TPR) repeat protein